MATELEYARTRLAFHAGVAAAVRRQCGMEWSPRGYQALRRMARMQQQSVRIPRGVTEIHLVRTDPQNATVLVEYEQTGRTYHLWVPQIAVTRFKRKNAHG